jgi:hypothetical protein
MDADIDKPPGIPRIWPTYADPCAAMALGTVHHAKRKTAHLFIVSLFLLLRL